MTFTLNDGSVRTMSAAFPRGHPQNPVSTAALEDKFRTLVAPRYSPMLAEKAIQAVRQIESGRDWTRAFADLAWGASTDERYQPARTTPCRHPPGRARRVPHVRRCVLA